METCPKCVRGAIDTGKEGRGRVRCGRGGEGRGGAGEGGRGGSLGGTQRGRQLHGDVVVAAGGAAARAGGGVAAHHHAAPHHLQPAPCGRATTHCYTHAPRDCVTLIISLRQLYASYIYDYCFRTKFILYMLT